MTEPSKQALTLATQILECDEGAYEATTICNEHHDDWPCHKAQRAARHIQDALALARIKGGGGASWDELESVEAEVRGILGETKNLRATVKRLTDEQEELTRQRDAAQRIVREAALESYTPNGSERVASYVEKVTAERDRLRLVIDKFRDAINEGASDE